MAVTIQIYLADKGFTNAASAAVDGLLAKNYSNLLQQTYQQKRRTAQEAYSLYHGATAGTLPGNIIFSNTVIGRQLRQVCKTIMGRTSLGAVRQTFHFVMGGSVVGKKSMANSPVSCSARRVVRKSIHSTPVAVA